MSLTEKFRESAIEQSLGRNTITCYAHWHRQFYAFCKVPASRWDGELVRRCSAMKISTRPPSIFTPMPPAG